MASLQWACAFFPRHSILRFVHRLGSPGAIVRIGSILSSVWKRSREAIVTVDDFTQRSHCSDATASTIGTSAEIGAVCRSESRETTHEQAMDSGCPLVRLAGLGRRGKRPGSSAPGANRAY